MPLFLLLKQYHDIIHTSLSVPYDLCALFCVDNPQSKTVLLHDFPVGWGPETQTDTVINLHLEIVEINFKTECAT